MKRKITAFAIIDPKQESGLSLKWDDTWVLAVLETIEEAQAICKKFEGSSWRIAKVEITRKKWITEP